MVQTRLDAAALGLIGDVHAEDERLELALAALAEQGVSQILCVGDIVDGRGDANRCCTLLQTAGVLTVRGNHDEWCLQDRLRDLPEATPRNELTASSLTFLQALPATLSSSTPAGEMLLCHGLGENNMARLRPDDFGYALAVNDDLQRLLARPGLRFVIAGHSHRPMVRQIENVLFFNPGGLLLDQDCGFMIFVPTTGQLRRVSGLEAGAVAALQETELPLPR